MSANTGVGVVDVRLERDGELVPTDTSGAVGMFERFMRDPSVDVAKFERLMALWERTEAARAKNDFNVGMSAAQKDMRPVAADADNPQTRSRYASYKALDQALRPIYTAHGFGLSFNTGETPIPDYVRVLCLVTHIGGHAHEYHIDMPADGKGAKGGDVMTKTHAVGSAVSYGMRYLLKMIFNVAVGEDDDDGNGASGREHDQREASESDPKGFAEFVLALEAEVPKGTAKLMAAFNKGDVALRNHLARKHTRSWNSLKARASEAGK